MNPNRSARIRRGLKDPKAPAMARQESQGPAMIREDPQRSAGGGGLKLSALRSPMQASGRNNSTGFFSDVKQYCNITKRDHKSAAPHAETSFFRESLICT